MCISVYPRALLSASRPSVVDWGGGMSAGCSRGPTVAGAGNGWPHSALRYH